MAISRPTGWRVAASLVFSLALLAPPAAAVTDADRMAVYKEFRAQFDSRQYAAAKPLAEKLVQLTQEQYGAEELPVSTPLTNLATVNYKLGDYPAAIDAYLHGLGVSFLGANDPESAVVALKRAADLSRNTDGLFNINQVEFIDSLIDAYESTGRFAEAEKESMYALRVEEAAYGRSSVKLLDRLDKLARWYEGGRRFTTERAVYDRALAILQKAAPQNDLRKVGPLRGIARSYRLELFYGPEGSDTGSSFNAGTNGAPTFTEGTQNRRGESSLLSALTVAESTPVVDQQVRGEVLVDLGDWYLVTGALRRAYDTYADAWKALAQVNGTGPIEVPRLIAYRPSISSVDRSQLSPEEAVLKVVEMHFTVDRDGRIDDVTSPTTDVPESVVRNSISSMKRSRYAPRIENGAAVPTTDVVFRERVLIKATSPESPPESGKAEPAEAKPEAAPEPETKTEPEKKE